MKTKPSRPRREIDPKKLTSIEEAEHTLLDLVQEIEEIQDRLHEPNKTDPNGVALTPDVYRDWRKRALFALRIRLDTQRRVKQWIRERQRRIAMAAAELDGSDPYLLVAAALGVIKTRCAVDALPARDQHVVTALEAYLETS